jgi:hypothetical protein
MEPRIRGALPHYKHYNKSNMGKEDFHKIAFAPAAMFLNLVNRQMQGQVLEIRLVSTGFQEERERQDTKR